jgi:diguanylate cyclase (GGDEF)-like protein
VHIINFFDEEDLKLTELLISNSIAALKRIQSEKEIRFLSFHDSLTNLYNRAFFEEELKRLDTERSLPLSVIVGDINNLKLVNDTMGHLEGDKLLKNLTKILKKSCRKEDIISRWGGDEFVILLPNLSFLTARKFINRIKANCKNAVKDPVELSIALGAATKVKIEENIKDIIKKAEDMMYGDKKKEHNISRTSIINSFKENLTEGKYEETTRLMIYLSKKLGEIIGLSKDELKKLEYLVLLRDIGKLAIVDNVISMMGKLSINETNSIRKHVEIGSRVVKSFEEMASLSEAILSHHERWDGRGYPRGLKKDKSPLISRILFIVESFTSLIIDGKDKLSAVESIKNQAGSKFDPVLVKEFNKIIMDSLSVETDYKKL